MSTDTPLVRVENLTKQYGSFLAVDDLSLSQAPGEIVALLGPNGAGKTTTLRMLMGVLQPSHGTASIMGHDCFSERADVMRYVGYLPDEPAFYDFLRGREIIEFVAGMHGLDPVAASQYAGELCDRLGLTEALEEYAVNYSKGMKKKLALVCALIHRPALLILDEPTNGLDPFATRTLHALLRGLSAENTAVLFSTHLLDQAERLCHRVLILHEGKLAAQGALGDLQNQLRTGGTLEEIFFQVAGEGEEPEEEADAAATPSHLNQSNLKYPPAASPPLSAPQDSPSDRPYE